MKSRGAHLKAESIRYFANAILEEKYHKFELSEKHRRVNNFKSSNEETSMSIIVNPEYLSDSYLPEKLLHREKEKAKLTNNLKNFVSTFLHGPCGSGKTNLVKKVIRSLNKAPVSYVDCTIYQTTYSILKEIVPRAKLIFCRSNYELLKELMRETREKKFILCLDNFEKLKEKDLIKRFLLLNITVILITDEEGNLSLLTEDVRAKLSRIGLQPYTEDQTFEILMDRAKKALAEKSFTEDLIRKIAEKVNGNITLGINLLKLSAMSAENEKREVIEVEDIPEVGLPLKLSLDEKILLKILKKWRSLPSRKLYDIYIRTAKYPKGERSFRNYMARLCSRGLVRAEGEKRGRIYEIVC